MLKDLGQISVCLYSNYSVRHGNVFHGQVSRRHEESEAKTSLSILIRAFSVHCKKHRILQNMPMYNTDIYQIVRLR